MSGSYRGSKFRPTSDGLEMDAKLSEGANEIRMGCLALSFISRHDLVLVGTNCGGSFTPTRPDSKCLASELWCGT